MEFQQTPLLGMYACDADLFERVWERVGAQARPDCPVSVLSSGFLCRKT